MMRKFFLNFYTLLFMLAFSSGAFMASYLLGTDNQESREYSTLMEKRDRIKNQVYDLFNRKELNKDELESSLVKMFLAYLGVKIENKKLKLLMDDYRDGENVSEKESPLNDCLNEVWRLKGKLNLREKSIKNPPNPEKSGRLEKKEVGGRRPRRIKRPKLFLPPLVEASAKIYLSNSMPFSKKNNLMKAINGRFMGFLITKNNEKLKIKIQSDYQLKNKYYTGKSFVEISNFSETFLVSGSEYGRNTVFRYSRSDELPLLIIKIRPRYFLRLQYSYSEKSFSGHLYYSDAGREFYFVVGEVLKLQKI